MSRVIALSFFLFLSLFCNAQIGDTVNKRQFVKDTALVINQTVIALKSDSLEVAVINFLKKATASSVEKKDLLEVTEEKTSQLKKIWESIAALGSMLMSGIVFFLGLFRKRKENNSKMVKWKYLLFFLAIVFVFVAVYFLIKIAILLVYVFLVILALLPLYAYVLLRYLQYFDRKPNW